MMGCRLGAVLVLAVAIAAFVAPARGQGGDPSAGAYCEPAPQTKLLYSNRGYLILPKPADAPPLAYSYSILGTESITVGTRGYKSWKIRRTDHMEDGSTTTQLLWYSPELCTLSAFTDSQQRTIALLRVLKPGEHDYNRAVARRNGKLVFTDTGEAVK